jgi:DNA-binding SARP family transcriptional activator/class 3 adenylate cyclase/predicted alpha/beta hydrolase
MPLIWLSARAVSGHRLRNAPDGGCQARRGRALRSGWLVKFLVLGPLEVHERDRPIKLGSAKQRLLLAALLVHANTVLSVDRLADILWGDDLPVDAAATVQNHVSRLRAVLEPGRAAGGPGSMLLTRPTGYELRVEQDQVDASCFEGLVAEGRVALREGDPAGAAERLGEALGLWRGAALAEFADEPFAQAEAARLEELRLSAFEDRIEAELAQGRHGDVIADLEVAARDNPSRERLWARWMLALYRCGRQAEALGAYRELRTHLGEELGITPSPELVALEEAIVLQKPELDWVPAPPQPVAAEAITQVRGTERDPLGTSPMLVMPKTRYAKASDGVHIAYQVIGDGPFDLVEVGGFASHLEFAWEGVEYSHYLHRLSRFARLISFDKRGTGMSDPVPVHALPSLEQRMDDFRAVLDAVGSERAALFGESDGGQMAALFAATYPERTRALVTYGSYARLRSAPDFPLGQSDEFLDDFATDMEANWGGEIPEGSMWAVTASRNPQFRDWLARWNRNSASPGAAATMLRMIYEIDVRQVLPAIRVPTLVLHRVDDPLIPIDHGRYFAAHIPGAKFVELPGDDRLVFAGDVDRLVDEIEEFLTGHRPQASPDRVLATVLYTDIVDSTRRASQLGDQRWRELLDRHDELLRREFGRFRGEELTATGDGFLAAFDGPARAVHCALAAANIARTLGLELRVGVHTGECEQRGDNLSGIAVHTAARIATFAEPGEVLVSRTVTDLVAGSGLEFSDHGEHELKGVPGQWQLFAAQAT